MSRICQAFFALFLFAVLVVPNSAFAYVLPGTVHYDTLAIGCAAVTVLAAIAAVARGFGTRPPAKATSAGSA